MEAKCILTEELIRKALWLARPSVEAILLEDETVWGPRCVYVFVDGPGLDSFMTSVMGSRDKWQKEWGKEEDFGKIAWQKLLLARRTGMPTGVVISRYPWMLKEGDFLYEGGTAGSPNGLSVGVSGAHGQTDEGIADIIYAAIVMLCRLKVRRMKCVGTERV